MQKCDPNIEFASRWREVIISFCPTMAGLVWSIGSSSGLPRMRHDLTGEGPQRQLRDWKSCHYAWRCLRDVWFWVMGFSCLGVTGAVLGWQLDWMILKVFLNFGDSLRSWEVLNCSAWRRLQEILSMCVNTPVRKGSKEDGAALSDVLWKDTVGRSWNTEKSI